MKNQTKDLTKGTPWKQIVIFSLPLIVSFLFQNLYNVADSINLTTGSEDLTTGTITIDSFNFVDTDTVAAFEVAVLRGEIPETITLALSDNILNNPYFSGEEAFFVEHIIENVDYPSPYISWDEVMEGDAFDVWGTGTIEIVDNSIIKLEADETEKRALGRENVPVGELLHTINIE